MDDQRQATQNSDFVALGQIAEARDRIMRSLVTIEEGLRSVRQALVDHRQLATAIPGYEEVARRHREAAAGECKAGG
jgi:hypothetical protein